MSENVCVFVSEFVFVRACVFSCVFMCVCLSLSVFVGVCECVSV